MRGKEAPDGSHSAEIKYPQADDYRKKISSIDSYDFDRSGDRNDSVDLKLHQHELWAKSFDKPDAPVKGKRAIFSNMNLENFDFSGRDLRAADFRFAELSGANFSQADLTLADFSGAIVENANFNDATMIKTVFRDTVTDGATFDNIVENY